MRVYRCPAGCTTLHLNWTGIASAAVVAHCSVCGAALVAAADENPPPLLRLIPGGKR